MVFVGRQWETSRIKAELAKRGNVVVSGTFGIGRTALIHHVAEAMGDAWRFIFLDFSRTPAQLCSDLIAWLRPRTAGRSARRRLSFVSARAIVLKLEARGRRRWVLVLDNIAAVTAPKLALLRRLVATGRYRFVAITDHHLPDADLFTLRACLNAAPIVTLANLPRAVAGAFFAGVSGDLGLGWREGEVAALAEITDGYPLLMVEAIARARRRHAGGPDKTRPPQGGGAQFALPSRAGGRNGRE